MCTCWWFQPLWKIWKAVRVTIPNRWTNKTCYQITNQYLYIYNTHGEYIEWIWDDPNTQVPSSWPLAWQMWVSTTLHQCVVNLTCSVFKISGICQSESVFDLFRKMDQHHTVFFPRPKHQKYAAAGPPVLAEKPTGHLRHFHALKHGRISWFTHIPSGKRLQFANWKSPFWMGKATINHHFQ